MASTRKRITPELAILGASTAASLTAIDLVYGGTGRISRVYLVDALTQVGILGLWIAARSKEAEPLSR